MQDEVKIDLRKVEAGDETETKFAEAVQREIDAGNLEFKGYDRGKAVYAKPRPQYIRLVG